MKLIAGQKIDEKTLRWLLDSLVNKYDGDLVNLYIRPNLGAVESELLANWRHDYNLTIEKVVDYIKMSRKGEIKLYSVCYMDEKWNKQLPANAQPICEMMEGYIYSAKAE